MRFVCLVLLAVSAIAVVAQPAHSSCAKPLRIMPFGDSITGGYSLVGQNYRPKLYNLLASEYDIDFVGARTHSNPVWLSGQPIELVPLADNFDLDNSGRAGARAKFGLADAISDTTLYLPDSGTDLPDVVIIYLGINDMSSSFQTSSPAQTVADISSIVFGMQNAHAGSNPLHILVSTVKAHSARGLAGTLSQFNSLLLNQAPTWSAGSDLVHVVDPNLND